MALRARRPVEQWLGVRDQAGRRVIKWLRIEPDRYGDEFAVCLSEVFDTGNENFFDLGEFEPVDADEPNIFRTFADWESALAHAISLGASREQFVPNGRVQDVYEKPFMDQRSDIPTSHRKRIWCRP